MMMSIGLLIIRLVIGLSFVGHGAQKLFGWFGGYGIKGTGQWMESIGIKPGATMAFLAGLAEFAGGLLFALGLLTPLCGYHDCCHHDRCDCKSSRTEWILGDTKWL